MRITLYWKIVLKRIVDGMALHVLFAVQSLVNKDLESEIVNELLGANGGAIKQMFEDASWLLRNVRDLARSNKLPKESTEIVAATMDRVAAYGEYFLFTCLL